MRRTNGCSGNRAGIVHGGLLLAGAMILGLLIVLAACGPRTQDAGKVAAATDSSEHSPPPETTSPTGGGTPTLVEAPPATSNQVELSPLIRSKCSLCHQDTQSKILNAQARRANWQVIVNRMRSYNPRHLATSDVEAIVQYLREKFPPPERTATSLPLGEPRGFSTAALASAAGAADAFRQAVRGGFQTARATVVVNGIVRLLAD